MKLDIKNRSSVPWEIYAVTNYTTSISAKFLCDYLFSKRKVGSGVASVLSLLRTRATLL